MGSAKEFGVKRAEAFGHICRFTVFGFLLACGTCYAADAGISLASPTAAPGSSVLVPVTLTAPGAPIGAVQFDLEYDNTIMSVAATLGDSSHTSIKNLLSSDPAPGTKRFLLVGLNENGFQSGVVLNLFISLRADAAGGEYALKLSNAGASDPAGVLTAIASTDATLTIQQTADQNGAVQPAGVLNLGSQLPGAVAPGELVTLLGAEIGPSLTMQPSAGAPGNGASVLFDGVPAPILYSAVNEIHAVAPYEISGESTTNLQVINNGMTIASLSIPVAAASPSLVTVDGSGVGQGAILNQDLTPNSPSNPASGGLEVVLYGTGVGQMSPPGVDGAIAGDAFSTPILSIGVQVGGVDAQVIYAGSAPGLISGVIQVNCIVPQGLASGPAVPVTLIAGTLRSPPGATLAIH